MQKPENVFSNFLRTKGLKLTSPRKIILEAVFTTHEHFNVDAMYDLIRQTHSNVSRATIYRTMPLLVEAGLIKQSVRCQAKDYYEHIYGHSNHLHLICKVCGEIIEADSKEVEKAIEKIALKYNFSATEFDLAARGICSTCSEQE